VSRSRLINNWERDLRALSDDGVRARIRRAGDRVDSSLAPGAGRNPNAARMWRENLRAAEAELERRERP